MKKCVPLPETMALDDGRGFLAVQAGVFFHALTFNTCCSGVLYRPHQSASGSTSLGGRRSFLMKKCVPLPETMSLTLGTVLTRCTGAAM